LKRLNARRVKIHRNYTVDEAARLFDVHKNTVRNWMKSGLAVIDERRPTLVLGLELAKFLEARRRETGQRCGPGQLYCIRCRTPKHPADRRADYVPITSGSGNLRGRCPDCQGTIYRLVSLSKLTTFAGDLDVQRTQAQQRIEESPGPCLDCDFEPEVASDVNAQR
jgi:hypothetical protein